MRVRKAKTTYTWHDMVPVLLREHGARAVAEIGVWKGDLSELILTQCPMVNRLYLVDPWLDQVVLIDKERWAYLQHGETQEQMDECYRITMAKVQPYGERVRVIRLPSVKAAAEVLDESLDAVLIDALHFENTVKDDISAWLPKLKRGGVMIGDDYSTYFAGVQRGVEAIFGARHHVIGQTWWTFPEKEHVCLEK